MAALISVPAGRCARRGETNWIDPQPDKGLLEVKYEDDLMHLWWKSRPSGAVEDELIIFPGEATFEKVTQDVSGRTHILKFSSSDQKYFFWFQRGDKSGDLRAQVDINGLLQDPTYQLGSAPLPDSTATPTAAPALTEENWPPTPGAPLLSHPEPAPPAPRSPPLPESSSSFGLASGSAAAEDSGAGTEDMARLLVEWAQSGGLSSMQHQPDESAHLTDILNPQSISALLSAKPEIGETLAPLLPPGLGLSDHPTPEELMPILAAPQWSDAIGSLDNALRSGGLPGSMMRELGLPESAGTGVGPFLDALKGLKKDAGTGADEHMDTDE